MSSGIKQAIQQQFGQVAANYSTSIVHAQGVDLARMVAAVPLTPTMYILDAGCGAGHTALAFAPHVAQVIAYDLTPPMLAQVGQLAQTRGISNIRTQPGDVEALPFAAATFDVVVSRYSAHHWVQPAQALREIYRVLRPGGMFILSDVVAPDDDYPADTFLQTLELLRDPSHVRDHTSEQWLALLRAAAFSAERLELFEIPLHFGQWLERIATPPVLAAAIRALMQGAAPEIKAQFQLPQPAPAEYTDAFTFRLTGGIFRALKSA